MKIYTRLLAILFVGLLLLPAAQARFHLVREPVLAGKIKKKAKTPVVGLSIWLDAESQRLVTRWWNENIGFRGYLVKTWNQMMFSLFGTMDEGKGTRVLVGKNGYLYESSYLDSYNKPGETPEGDLRRLAVGMKALQDALASRGIAFLVLIAPSKVEIYPEYLPDRLILPGRSERQTDHDRMIPILDELGVQYLDGHRLFQEARKASSYDVFPRTGVHWNFYGASLVVEEMVRRLERQLGRPLPNIRCKGARIDDRVRETDNDLGNLLNVWAARMVPGPQTHPVLERVPEEGGYLPNILFVGDSFVHTLTKIMDVEGLYRKRDFFYYFNRRFPYPGQPEKKRLNRSGLDWKTELLARDAIVIERIEIEMQDLGCGFVEWALDALSAEVD